MRGLLTRRWTIILFVLPLVGTAAQITTPLHSVAARVRPNVLIIVTDDQREGLGVMPETRRWLQRGGTRFSDAFVTTPICCPSRSSIFTGRYAHNHHVFASGAGGNLAQGSTLQFYLHKAGYETAMFGKYLNAWDITQRPPHFNRYAMTVRSHFYKGGTWNINGTVKTLPGYNTTYIAHKAQVFLRHQGAAHPPWFLYLATAAPHLPATAQRKYANAAVSPWYGNPAVFESDRSDKPPYVQDGTTGLPYGRRTRRAQLRALMSVDDLVAKVSKTLRDLHEAKNTLVFFISDNGVMWGEHGLQKKGVPYEPSIKVPFFARWPGHFPAGVTDDRIVANIDIAPTVLRATGVAHDPAYPIDGRSLLGSTAHRTRLLTEYFPSPIASQSPQGTWASTRTDNYKYTEYYADDGTTVTFREYYDLRNDPWELDNLLGDGDPSNDPNVARLSRQLAQERACEGKVGLTACP